MAMNRKLYPRAALLLLVLGFISFSALNSMLFGSLRVDLTENRLYTISAGTREIINSIEEPVDLYFFFSDKATQDLAPLRTYARRVREMLEEYALASDGRIRLRVIDPAPFSEAEDQAAEFGLQAVPLDGMGDEVYFGLAATNAYGEQAVIGFFQPDREEFLEYEISKLLNGLVQPSKPVVGVISGLQINGGFDMVSSRPTAPWVVMDQLAQGFDVRYMALDGDSIDEDVTTLMIVHPSGLSESLLYAIDQFVLRGGKAIVYVDPYCESARASANPMLGDAPQSSSDLAPLFKAWGLQFDVSMVVADAGTALQISYAADQPPAPHLAFLGLGVDNIAQQDVVTGRLELLNLGMSGALSALEGASTRFEPLLQSSTRAALIDSARVQVSRNPSTLLDGFAPTGERYTLAARISGAARSAFEGARTEGAEHLAEAANINVIVVADADMLADRFWVQVQDFFGQQLASAWADNAAFAQNALENLSGSSALIDVRSRGRFSRPFELVQQIRLGADARYRESAERLQQRLEETEHQLGELQRSKAESNSLVLSPEQERTLQAFQQEKLQIRKQLREVRHQLDRDIDRLGMGFKLLNIVVAPLLLTLLLLGWHRWRQLRSRRRDSR